MTPQTKIPPINILLADDDDDDRRLFNEMIEKTDADISLATVKNGFQLMHALSEAEWLPDVIFLDLNMPYKSGADCLSEIRADNRLKDIPIVIFSTSGSKKDINETYNKGANLFVCKPVNFEVQKKIFKKILSINWKEFMPFSSKANFYINENSTQLLCSFE